jgi:hypothetical protein
VSTREPRLATWILQHCISDYRCDSLIGDLVEQYPQRGTWWYWRQAVNSIRVRAIRTLVTATETKASAAELVGDLIVWIVLAACGCVHLLICAGLLLSLTPFPANQAWLQVIGAALICAAFIGAVTAAHAIRLRTVRQPCVPHSPAW